ncbi:MAG: hypothetical protein CO126_04375 [Hydrogenophilales bacterium CG_4_9_14_3_um_filter_63_34]|nr:MAG: hypothetical protein CO126_04375 [Hydrogenophilales bacterium CG_4_9_14_3_um_filter_63_34]
MTARSTVACSIARATTTICAICAGSLLARSDIALYRAKNGGRNRVKMRACECRLYLSGAPHHGA